MASERLELDHVWDEPEMKEALRQVHRFMGIGLWLFGLKREMVTTKIELIFMAGALEDAERIRGWKKDWA